MIQKNPDTAKVQGPKFSNKLCNYFIIKPLMISPQNEKCSIKIIVSYQMCLFDIVEEMPKSFLFGKGSIGLFQI